MRGHWQDAAYCGVLLPPGVIVAPEGIYVGRVCPPGPVGSMLLVWTDLVKARRNGRRGAYVPFGGTDAGGRSGLYSAAGCTRTHFRITNLSWLAVNGEKPSSWLLMPYWYSGVLDSFSFCCGSGVEGKTQ